MLALFKFSIFLVLIIAVAVGVYLYTPSPSDDSVTAVPATPQAPIARVVSAPMAPNATASVAQRALPGSQVAPSTLDENCKLDGERLQRLRSHPSSEEVERFDNELRCEALRPQLLGLMKDLVDPPAAASAPAEASGLADARSTVGVAPPAASSAATEGAPSAPDEICKSDEERLQRLRSRPSREEASRFASALRCEALRPQLVSLMETLAPAPAAADASNGASSGTKTTIDTAPPAMPSAASAGALSSSDEICKRDAERLEQLLSRPSKEEASRFASELRCETLRPQLASLMETLAASAPTPAAADGSNGGSADTKTTIETAPSAAPSAASDDAVSASDEICKRDAERLEQLRSRPSKEEASRFASALRCETLRPQLLALMETLAALSPGPTAADVSNRGSPEAKTTIETAPPAGPSATGEATSFTPDEICRRDEERLERLRGSPSGDEAARFGKELRCETLRPQLTRLMESLGYAPTRALQSPSIGEMSVEGSKAVGDCVSEQDKLNRIRAKPSADAAQQFWRDLQCERLRPQVLLLLESMNVGAGPPVACHKEAEELNRIRANPNRREAEAFARDMTCDELKPQAARLLDSLAE